MSEKYSTQFKNPLDQSPSRNKITKLKQNYSPKMGKQSPP